MRISPAKKNRMKTKLPPKETKISYIGGFSGLYLQNTDFQDFLKQPFEQFFFLRTPYQYFQVCDLREFSRTELEFHG